MSVDLDQLNDGLAAWTMEAIDSYGAAAVHLFGSLIHKGGAQFNESSDVDLVVVMPTLENASARYRWLERFSEHKEALEARLMRILRRTGSEPSASIVAVTDLELSFDVHKDGHRQFFTANTFRNLSSKVESEGIFGSGNANTNRFVAAGLAFAQKIRNEYLAVSANGTPHLVAYNGPDPLPKRIMRAAAMAARAAGLTASPGSEHDVQEGLDLLSNRLYQLRTTAPVYVELQDLVSVRRGARGRHRQLEATHQLLLAELVFDIASETPAPSGTSIRNSDFALRSEHNGQNADGVDTEASAIEPARRPKQAKIRGERTSEPFGSTTAFFADRFASAFPGVRSITWFSDSDEIATRLLALLRAPLSFSDATPIWWWRGGNLHITNFKRIRPDHFLMDIQEMRIKLIAAVPGMTYQRHFVYVRTDSMPPTGLYSDFEKGSPDRVAKNGYDAEEYGLLGDRLITRAEYDDGATMIDGKLVETSGQAKLRVRYTSPYNFLIAANGSPINNPRFDSELEHRLNAALKGDEKREVVNISEAVRALPLRDTRFA